MLQIENLGVRIAGRPLLENASLSLPKGTKAGLVGRNGCGKTTLFKVILGEHPTETGSVSWPKDMSVGHVAQEAPGTDQSLLEIVLAADSERLSLLEEAETATEPNRISEIHMRLADIDAHSAESRAATILAGLGFSHSDQLSPAASFSGGWRMRVALAAILFARPDLLLLDEPTNYLDLEGTLWLENYLSRYPGTVLIISHDRDLLNIAVDNIIHFEGHKLQFYKGSYDTFERNRELQRELAEKTRTKMEKQTAHMQAFVDRFRYKASKAKQAQSKLKAIEKIKLPALLEESGVMPINFPDPQKQASSPIIKLENLSCGYDADLPVLKNLSLNINADDRIALLGSNGNGKSTFAKLLCERLPQVHGELIKPPKLKVAMFAQHQMDDLHADQTPVDHLRALMPNMPEGKIRSRVAQLGLDHERMNTLCKNLSGGEKARLLLGICCFHGPDLLILDEPTNHLDMGAREALANGLNAYEGAVILISHDRHLIDATMEQLWRVDGGKVLPYDEDLETYRKQVLKSRKKDKGQLAVAEIEVEEKPPEISNYDLKKQQAEKRKQYADLKKQIYAKEQEMRKFEEKIAKCDTALSQAGLFENDPEKGAQLSKLRAQTESDLAKIEELWLEMSADYEAKVGWWKL